MPAETQVLIVDDNRDFLDMLRRKLVSRGYKVMTAEDANKALAILNALPVDILLTDYKMPITNGLELIRHIRLHYSSVSVIMLTGYPTIEGAVEAVKLGAEEYLSKPFTDDELMRALDSVRERIKARALTSKEPVLPSNPYGLIGESEEMQKVYAAIAKSCTNSATVLIEGESGTGKELVARAIHYHSPRERSPFVPVNCAAIPETLLESELFGFMRGSFTGAHETRAGHFITADGGTIFLDEIGEMPLSMQVKLLRVLQDRQVYMIGAKTPRKVNVRVIAATNKDLQLLLRQGSFREDLYYRLNVLPIRIPPLRERSGDIMPLLSFFLNKYAVENTLPVPALDPEALRMMNDYHWPGNVREFENLIYRLVILSEGGTIKAQDLPDYMKFSLPLKTNLTRSLAELETEYIKAVVASVDGNKSRAAQILGISRKTLHLKLSAIESSSEKE